MRHMNRGDPRVVAALHYRAFERAGSGRGADAGVGGPGARAEHRERAHREGRERHGRRGRPDGRGYFADAEPVQVSTEAIAAWLTGRLPEGWFTEVRDIVVDRDEITVIGQLPAVEGAPEGESNAEAVTAAEEGRISRFREETREQRIAIAREAEARYGRTVAWGAQAGGTTVLFSNRSVPVMTRLRQPERTVLDTLVDSGVARSRSDALAWCVRLVGRNSEAWLSQLRDAMSHVERVREQGPGA